MVKKLSSKDVTKFYKKSINQLPSFVTLDKILEEIFEHLDLVKWGFFRVIVPLIILHFLINLVLFQKIRIPVTIFSIIFYLYGAFFVDLDSFFNKKKNSVKATKIQKLAIICLTPLAIYYMLSTKMKPIYLPNKYFHQKRVLYIFGIFSFILGYIIFLTPIDAIVFMCAGITGYLTHLATDKIIFN